MWDGGDCCGMMAIVKVVKLINVQKWDAGWVRTIVLMVTIMNVQNGMWDVGDCCGMDDGYSEDGNID